MELDPADAAVVLLTHDVPCESLRAEGLARSGCALEDKVLLPFQKAPHRVQVVLGYINVLQEVGVVIGLVFGRGGHGAVFARKLQDAVVLLLGKRKETAVGVLDELRLAEDLVRFDVCVGNGLHQVPDLPEVDVLVIGGPGDLAQGDRFLHRSGLVADDDIARLHP